MERKSCSQCRESRDTAGGSDAGEVRPLVSLFFEVKNDETADFSEELVAGCNVCKLHENSQ